MNEEEKDWMGRSGFGLALEGWGGDRLVGRPIYFRGQAAVVDVFDRARLKVGIKPIGSDTLLPPPIGVDPEGIHEREFDLDPDRRGFREIVFAAVDSPEICWRRTLHARVKEAAA